MIKELLQNMSVLEALGPLMGLAFILALFLALKAFPPLLFIAQEKHLTDEPDDRSSHQNRVPTLGGMGVYISLILVLCLFGVLLDTSVFLVLSGALTALFFIGMKDDLVVLSPLKKFLGQLVTATILVLLTDIRIIGFSELFGVTTLPYTVSVAFTIFVYILIINAYNFIDGIDGLAGSFAVLVCGIYGGLFYYTDNPDGAVLAMALLGALLPFLRLNLSKRKKIFMGDTGSMIIGFMLAFFTVDFIHQNQGNAAAPFAQSAPIIAMAILFYPLMDLLRIFLVRLLVYRVSPFRPDKRHMHHFILRLGCTHIQTTSMLMVMSGLVVLWAFIGLDWPILVQLLALVLVGSALFTLPFLIRRRYNMGQAMKTLQLKLRMFLSSF